MIDVERIDVSPYTLAPLRGGGLGRLATTGGVRRGCLLRVRWRDLSEPGHADLHPWPELGDGTLEEQIAALRCDTLSPSALPINARRALTLARTEAEAASRGVALFERHGPIENHRLIPDLQSISLRELSVAAEAGYQHFKVKVGTLAAAEESAALRRLADALPPTAKLRLDFNGSFRSAEALCREWHLYASAIGERIEWVEDPLAAFDPEGWRTLQRELGVRFALDRGGECEFANAARHAASAAVGVWIVKPAIQDEQPLLAALAAFDEVATVAPQICVTSYLDHPLGQITALWVAGCIAQRAPRRLGVCGLASQSAYVPGDLSSLLRMHGSCLEPPLDAGWGCTPALAALAWERLR